MSGITGSKNVTHQPLHIGDGRRLSAGVVEAYGRPDGWQNGWVEIVMTIEHGGSEVRQTMLVSRDEARAIARKLREVAA